MNKQKQLLTLPAIAILTLFINFSCINNDNSSNSLIIPVDFSKGIDKITASTFIDSIYAFKLELPEPYLWGNITATLFSKEHILVHDKKQNLLFSFSKKGDFQGLIGKQGTGPGEYVRIGSCFFSENYIYINDVAARCLYSYTFEGKYNKKISLPHDMIFSDIVALSDTAFLCYGCNDHYFKKNNGAWIMNDSGERMQYLLTFDTLYPYLHSDWKEIQKIEDSLILYYTPSCTYYSLSLKTLEVKEILRQRANIKMLSDYKANSKITEIDSDYATCNYFYYAPDWLFTAWSSPNTNNNNRHIKYALYSKEAGKNIVFDKIEVDIPGYNCISFPYNSNLENSLLGVFTDEYSIDLFPDQYKDMPLNERTAIFQVSVLKKANKKENF